jgi:ubiquinol-cytochrome c reductase cytochrome b subunit
MQRCACAIPSIKQKARGMCTQAGHTPDDPIFYQWLSGLIDGDGYFYLTKDGKVLLTITMDKRDIDCLLFIQSKLGCAGCVTKRKIYNVANQKAIRYRLFRKDDIFKLICAINGNIRNPIRINQLKPIYLKYNISPLRSYNLRF